MSRFDLGGCKFNLDAGPTVCRVQGAECRVHCALCSVRPAGELAVHSRWSFTRRAPRIPDIGCEPVSQAAFIGRHTRVSAVIAHKLGHSNVSSLSAGEPWKCKREPQRTLADCVSKRLLQMRACRRLGEELAAAGTRPRAVRSPQPAACGLLPPCAEPSRAFASLCEPSN